MVLLYLKSLWITHVYYKNFFLLLLNVKFKESLKNKCDNK
jgi:hypothetical protein